MKPIASLALLGLAGLTLAACGDADDASTEAMPDSVEMPAAEALEPIEADPVADDEVAGPPVEPVDRAPDPVTTNEAADDAEAVAAEAEAALEAIEGLDDIPSGE